MADLRIMLQHSAEESAQDMETDESPQNGECEDNSSQNNQQAPLSPNLSSGIMAFSESTLPSPLDVTTPEELLTPLARLRIFAVSDNIFNRRMIAHDACNMLQAVQNDENDFNAAVQCYLKLSEDLEPSVRVELMEQMAEITEKFNTRLLNSAVVPILLRYLTDVNNQVRKTCHAVLIDITKRGYLKVGQFENEVMPLLNDLTSRQQAPDDYRTEAVALICQICEAFGSDFAKQHFLPIFLESCNDETMFHVRKVCAANFSAFCDIFDDVLIGKELLPRFIKLCKDNVWGVRKSCAESFPDFAKHMSEDVRINTLSPLYSSLLSDQSRWVRVSAFESLGPFISTFADSVQASDTLSKEVPNTEDDDCPPEEEAANESGKDFESFLYWRDPIPAIVFDEDFPDTNDEIPEADQEYKDVFQDDEEIQSQVYVNSGSAAPPEQKDVIVVPTAHNSGDDSLDSGMQEDGPDQDSEYSPTKDGSSILKSVEFSADKENIPINFEAEGPTKPDSDEEYDNFDSVPSVHLMKIENSAPSGEGAVFGEEDTNEGDDSGTVENALEAGDAVVNLQKEEGDDSKKSSHQEKPEVNTNEDPETGSSDEEDFDDNEPKNWQTPGVQDFSDLYDCDYAEGSEIHYRMFGSDSLSYSRRERLGADHSTFDPVLSVHSVSAHATQQNIIPQPLLDNFLSMTDPSRKQTVDTEIAKHCAFSLPGVAYTLGRSNWHCLKDVYHKLATDVQWKVRRTIASSIHELAKILGEELTATELVPVFNGFLKDLDDVRIGVLQHLADFLQLLNPEVRGIYLYQLTDFLTIDNSRNWRFRYELARQLCFLIDLYNAEETWKYICPISMKLAMDKVVAVQEEAAKLITTLLAKLENSDSADSESGMKYFPLFVEKIITFLVKSQRWKERIVFCKMCNQILKTVSLPFGLFLKFFGPHLLELAKDDIVNVRISAAKVLSYAAETFCDEGEGADIFSALRDLQNDKDRDVRYFSTV